MSHNRHHISPKPGLSSPYQYAFNGQERDDELAGEGNAYNLGLREYDSRLGRMFSIDPRSNEYPWQSPFVYHANSPILTIDYKGGGADDWIKKDNKVFFDSEVKSAEQAKEKYGDDVTHLPEGSSIHATVNNTSYRFTFHDNGTVTNSEGQELNMESNFTTLAGTTIIGSKNNSGVKVEFGLNAAIGGGFGIDVGFVQDAAGDGGFYLNFNANAGLGFDVGGGIGPIRSTHSGPFLLEDYPGRSFSTVLGGRIGPVGTGTAYGGTIDLDKYPDVGSRMNVNNYGTGNSNRPYFEVEKAYTMPANSISVVTGFMSRMTKTYGIGF